MTRHANPGERAVLAPRRTPDPEGRPNRVTPGWVPRSKGEPRVDQPRGIARSARRARRTPHGGSAGEGAASDAELLTRHAAGDRDAFGELFRRHRDRLWAVAVRTLGDPEEAADALQDAMIAALRRADSFRGDSAVTTWLHRIVINAALDRMRRRAARPATACQDLDALATGGQSLADPSGSSDTAIDVRAALQHLSPEQHAALVLVDMLGYPVADAAQVLGVSEGTVKSRAARGRARLLPRLEHLRPGTGRGQNRRNQSAAARLLPSLVVPPAPAT
jgi:RNA polymerase sigma-70 factor, ECF subfamily